MSDSWKSELLGNVATLQRGFDLPHRLRRPGKVPIVTSSGVESTHNEAKVKAPGVVTGRYGTIGEVYFVDEDFWPHNTTLYVRDFHGNDPLFVSYLLRTIDFHMHSGKTGVPGVNRNDLHEITVSIPLSITEQKAIAEALSDADALIEALEQLIAKKRHVKQGAMQELLTGKRRLSAFVHEPQYKQTEFGLVPEDWIVVTVAELAGSASNIVDGPFGSNLKNSDYIANGIPVLQGLNITKDRFVWKDVRYISNNKAKDLYRSNAQLGDLLTVKIGSVGFSAIIDDLDGNDFSIIPANLLRTRIQNPNSNPVFVYYLLTSNFAKKKLRDLAGNTAQPAIGLTGFRNLSFAIPSSLEEQTAIAEILSDMDAEIAALEGKLTKARQVKQGMMQELLTGRIRLI